MENSFLSQEEIDALLSQNDNSEAKDDNDDSSDKEALLTEEEQDALGEIGNISAGSASTALSDILNQKVMIDTPKVWVTTGQELYNSFQVPYVIIEVNYTSGVEGANLLIIKQADAAIIADLMMGGTGKNVDNELDEMKLSALSEAMNQMVGASATSLSTIFNTKVAISPPTVNTRNTESEDFFTTGYDEENLAVISLNLQIGELLKSDIMQVLPVDIAKQEVELLMSGGAEETTEEPAELPEEESLKENIQDTIQEQPIIESPKESKLNSLASNLEECQNKNLDLILDIPLKVTVLLGKTKKPINEVLSLNPGSIIELQKLVDEPVDILVNGTLIAKGEVVVVNENFGVKITDIISREKRIQNLGE